MSSDSDSLFDGLDAENPTDMLAIAEHTFTEVFSESQRAIIRTQAQDIGSELRRRLGDDVDLEGHRDLLIVWTDEMMRPIVGDLQGGIELPHHMVYAVVAHILSIVLLVLEPDVPEPIEVPS